jgi:hypothetical protein
MYLVRKQELVLRKTNDQRKDRLSVGATLNCRVLTRKELTLEFGLYIPADLKKRVLKTDNFSEQITVTKID